MAVSALIVLVALSTTVLLHYEGLRGLSGAVDRVRIRPRQRMLLVIFGVIAIHLAEITVYALAYWFGEKVALIGSFGGVREARVEDYLYFSAETFTSLGLGDVYPLGDLRLVASMEVLNGLLLIGWSASFTYLTMQRYWDLHANPER